MPAPKEVAKSAPKNSYCSRYPKIIVPTPPIEPISHPKLSRKSTSLIPEFKKREEETASKLKEIEATSKDIPSLI